MKQRTEGSGKNLPPRQCPILRVSAYGFDSLLGT